MITMNINNESVGQISMEFKSNLDVLDFFNSLNKVKVVSHKNSNKHTELRKSLSTPHQKYQNTHLNSSEVYEEPFKKSLNHIPSAPTEHTEIVKEQPEASILGMADLDIKTDNAEPQLKKIASDNRRRRNYNIDRNQLLKYCIEAIQNNEDLTIAELSNLISRNLGIETDQEKTVFYRYLYQYISNRSKKNIDIIKHKNYVSLKQIES